jgi:hypothetical protein
MTLSHDGVSNQIIKKEKLTVAEESAKERKSILKETEDFPGACLQIQLGRMAEAVVRCQ